jgi:hypothetical protein
MSIQHTPVSSDSRAPLSATEIVVKALGARYPVIVAGMIPPGCKDMRAAVAEIRKRQPQWFHSMECGSAASVSA